MEELKNCPFCGGSDVCPVMNTELEGLEHSEGSGYFTVVCKYNNGGCGATSGYRPTRKDAIIAWNGRV